MAIRFPGASDDLDIVTSVPDRVPLSEADVDGGPATRAHAQHHRDLGAAVVALENLVAKWDHDHSGTGSAPGQRNGGKLRQENTHEAADTDRDAAALHHTLGYRAGQAAPGQAVNTRLNSVEQQAATAQQNVTNMGISWFRSYQEMVSWARGAGLLSTRGTFAYVEEEDQLFVCRPGATPVPVTPGVPAGTIMPVANGASKRGWLKCDGAEYSQADWPALYAAIGIQFGGGASTFRVPDLRRRGIVGRDDTQAAFSGMGKTGGAATHTHTEGSLSAALGPSSNDWTVTTFYPVDVNSRGPKTTTYFSVKTQQIAQDSRFFNHYVGVYGVTAAGNSYAPYAAFDWLIKAF